MARTDNEKDTAVTFTPIGVVESEFDGYASSDEMRKRPSRIVLRPEMAPGLMGLENETYILVLFNLHRATEYELQLHPGHNPANPLRGVFATRSQYRPNAIAATVAEIVSVEDNVINVTGLDAQDGSPVLDIKPFRSGFDQPGQAGQPTG
ncbi:MAG: tRNA (N6-threonylcarbamoyladenosine(37)-N6)-methyltransferase TrmO [Chloroflexi bacterium]|nr:tRNA (N6-threonylcarbamoyladenosine(37)-N6)-methyltransferase TrmO [Chloroflexota bacterium]